jgi:hypothetical protein
MIGRATFLVGLLAITTSCGGGGEARGGPSSGGIDKAFDKDKVGAESGGIIPVGNVPEKITSMTGRILGLASKARMLKVKEPVKLKVLAPAELVAVVKKKVTTEIPSEQIRGEGHAYAALGLIPEKYDYEGETYAMLEEELAGLYVPEDKTMYVAKDMAPEALESTVAHELVHALQDQHFGIGDKLKFKTGESDMLAAVHAMAEGDATSAMFDEMIAAKYGIDALKSKNATHVIPDRDPEQMLEEELAAKTKPSKISSAPRFLAVGLLAPYADGLRFIHAMRRRGGPLGWKAVDQAWARPPSTTEQLLHLEKYDANEPALDVPLATGNALGGSFKKTYDENFGEQGGRIAFTEWMDVKSAKKAAAGWGGDHVTLFENGDKHAVAWRVVFDNGDEAAEAYGLLTLGWARSLGVPALQQVGNEKDPKSESLQVWGALPTAPAPAADPKKDAKKETKKPEKAGLPALPDAGTGGQAVKLNGCRALKHAGAAVTLLSGVPCNAVVAWAAEVGKAP